MVSGCEGGVVSVWDVDNGSRVLRFAECHGKNEITAMALDTAGRRLLTGSRAGDIKVGLEGGREGGREGRGEGREGREGGILTPSSCRFGRS